MASFGELSAVASSTLASKIFGTVCDTLLKKHVFPLSGISGSCPRSLAQSLLCRWQTSQPGATLLSILLVVVVVVVVAVVAVVVVSSK